MRLLILLIFLLPMSNAAQILAFFPVSYKSHQIVFQHLLKGLAAKGHKITYVTSSSMGESYKNIEEIVIDFVITDFDKVLSAIDPALLLQGNGFKKYFAAWDDFVLKTELVLRKPVIQEFIQQKRKFDVILAEIFFYQQPFIGLANVFHAPVIDVNTNCGSHAYNNFFYNPNIYSYVTDFTTSYSDRMTLYERLKNTLNGLYGAYFLRWYYSSRQEKLFYSNFNITDSNKEKPSLEFFLQKNLVASIINSDPVLGYPRPLMPNTVQVAGITSQFRKPLPKNLQKFMDEAESGVIYFSLGTLLKWENLANHKEIFIEAFERLPQRVMWKYESDLQLKSPKILTGKWFPQGDILAHPNCRLFITHGGYLSLVETVDAGVPVIVIPFFADQPRNAHLAQVKGFGKSLKFDELTTDMIVDAIQEILSNKSYAENAKKMSALFNDHVVSPLDKAVHLVEYVIRHKGHPASQTGAKELSCFQYFLLDVIAIIVTIVLVISIIMYKIIQIVLSLLCSGSIVSKKRPSNSNKEMKKNR